MDQTTKIIIWLVVIVVVVWGGYTLFKGAPEAEGGVIKIGFMGALTGDGAAYGEPQLGVIKIGEEEINSAGGINGRKIEIIYEDGKCNGKDGANAVQKLVNVDKVKVILGGSCSSETLAGIPIVEEAKVVIVTGSATSPDLINKSKFFFRVYPNDSTQGRVLAEASTKRGWKKVAVIQEQTDYALGVVKAFTTTYEKAGGKIAKEEFATAVTDVRSQLTKLKGENFDALLISVQTPATGDRVLKQLSDLKWKPNMMINDVLINPETVERNKTILEGALAADFVLDETNEKLKKITEAYKARYDKDIAYPNYTSAVYDSLFVIKDAIMAVGYDGEKIAEWARTSIKDWPGASGLITVGEDGERSAGHQLKVIKNGKFELAE